MRIYSGIIEKYRKSHEGEGLNPILWYFGLRNVSIIVEEEDWTRIAGLSFIFRFRYPPPGVPWNKLIHSDNIGLSMYRKARVLVGTKSDETPCCF